VKAVGIEGKSQNTFNKGFASPKTLHLMILRDEVACKFWELRSR
jgi:hypothetical protein